MHTYIILCIQIYDLYRHLSCECLMPNRCCEKIMGQSIFFFTKLNNKIIGRFFYYINNWIVLELESKVWRLFDFVWHSNNPGACY